jgi:hypothetical protein
MAGSAPSIDELRARAAREGVTPTEGDLERVQGFLAAFVSAYAELERALPRETVPAGLFRPEAER